MRALLVAIGLVLVLGGIKGVLDPRPALATMGGGSFNRGALNQSVSTAELPTSSGSIAGWIAIILGASVIVAGLRVKDLKLPPEKSRSSADGDTPEKIKSRTRR
jgi:hypothetical protein